MNNRLKQLVELGQSPWLDYIHRDLIESGELQRLINEDELRGITSNPAIFEKAIVGTNGYDEIINTLARQGLEANAIYESIAIKDVQSAADVFYPVYQKTDGLDGYVSMEVNPHLARDTQGTINEAIRLWHNINRPNIMIKVPATDEGLKAIQQLIADGINVNVTLIFGVSRYRQTVEAYLNGLAIRDQKGLEIHNIASVASFFLSRIDLLIDPLLEKYAVTDPNPIAGNMIGGVACASAKIAYQIYLESFNNINFSKLEQKGASPQRLLWASTGTKNPQYSDVKYVDSVIARNSVNTMPQETLNAFRDHGNPRLTIEDNIDGSMQIFNNLNSIGIDIEQLTLQLENEGIEKFNKPFDTLITAIKQKSKSQEL